MSQMHATIVSGHTSAVMSRDLVGDVSLQARRIRAVMFLTKSVAGPVYAMRPSFIYNKAALR